jgi:hypothetical protein
MKIVVSGGKGTINSPPHQKNMKLTARHCHFNIALKCGSLITLPVKRK